ncbi:MAG: BppU family phage baseplate upper protein [[Clostridium] symbiosum]
MTQNVILNLKSPQAIQTDIAFTQGDYGEAKLTIAVKDDEQYITGDTGASISFLRADGNIVTGELSGTQGMYGYTFAGNELETSGKTVATVTIEYDGGRVSTAAFIFTVRYNPAYDKKIPAGPYITALEKIKNQAQTYVEYLSALIEQLQPDIGSAALTKADLVNGYTQTVAGIKAFDAAAAKTLKEIVDGKIDATKIVNNLLSTDASMVLSAALGPIIDRRLTDLLEKYNRLNSESFGVNPSYPGFPKIWGHVFTNNGNQYGNAAGDCYYLAISSEGKLLIGTQTNNATTITWRSGEIEAATAQTAVMYYANNNIVIADYKTKKVYFTLNLETNILIADANGWTKKYNLSSLTV